ncbi:SLAIN motif-containing protein-like isoform X2 [Oryzias latipes]
MIEDLSQKTDVQDHSESSWYQYFCSQAEFEPRASHDPFSCELQDENQQGNIWADTESGQVQRCTDRSFAKDARLRLEVLKSGCDLSSCCVTDSTLNSSNSEEDFSDCEETTESALDLVEILNIEDDEQDEQSWLYEPQKKQPLVEKGSALRWCRQVLDNRSPEMEIACRLLMNKLDQRSRHQVFGCSSAFHHGVNGSSVDKSSVMSSFSDSNSLDCSEENFPLDSSPASYKLQDITDVHIMARIQEASLRHDYVSMPSAYSRNQQKPTSCFNTATENTDEPVHENKVRACFPSSLPSVGSSRCLSPAPATKQMCQSPKLSRLHEQVTQFKLLKRAQNQASTGLARSPLRTSLRSLQAVRNSRSLETDDYQTAGQRSNAQPDVSSTRTACGFRSLSPASANFHNLKQSSRAGSVRVAAVKGLQRSQSLSPCRIPHPAKGYLPVHGRVFASPERPTTAAWSTRAPPVQRGKT